VGDAERYGDVAHLASKPGSFRKCQEGGSQRAPPGDPSGKEQPGASQALHCLALHYSSTTGRALPGLVAARRAPLPLFAAYAPDLHYYHLVDGVLKRSSSKGVLCVDTVGAHWPVAYVRQEKEREKKRL